MTVIDRVCSSLKNFQVCSALETLKLTRWDLPRLHLADASASEASHKLRTLGIAYGEKEDHRKVLLAAAMTPLKTSLIKQDPELTLLCGLVGELDGFFYRSGVRLFEGLAGNVGGGMVAMTAIHPVCKSIISPIVIPSEKTVYLGGGKCTADSLVGRMAPLYEENEHFSPLQRGEAVAFYKTIAAKAQCIIRQGAAAYPAFEEAVYARLEEAKANPRHFPRKPIQRRGCFHALDRAFLSL